VIDLAAALRRHFGHEAFRPGQDVLVSAVLDGQDLLAVMPTGSGKSLGFQLPALLLDGITLVVSPLISLMKDQVDELNRRGIAAGAINSQVDPHGRREAIAAARAGRLRLLYVAPERFASEGFTRILEELPVARFVIDEAHCVSEWGHDFRPDYRRLRDAARACRRGDGSPGRPPIAAFTATATPEVRDDIVDLLGLARPRVFVAGFDRPNIHLHVRPVSGDIEKREILPGLVAGRRALVYSSTRRGAETAATTLLDAGQRAGAYHAGLTDAERTKVQDLFANGMLQVVCATNAFGMGIDRPDIELVVHMDVPGSLEAYYQEIGRAGRDGREATALLLWNFADVKTREFLIEQGRDDLPGRPGVALDPAELARRKDLERKKLRRMVAYATATACYRATILRYFGDRAAREPCDTCGNCQRRAPLDPDELLLVRKILSGIARAGERYGRRKIAAMLVGRLDELPDPLKALSTTGLLDGESERRIQAWIDAACSAGLIRESADQYRTLSLTPFGREVMAGRDTHVELTAPAEAAAPTAGRGGRRRRDRKGPAAPPSLAEDTPPSLPVVEALRAWRLTEARSREMPPYVILHDRTLQAIATVLPRSRAELVGVPGIGPVKLDAYGDQILTIVASHRDRAPSDR
jgi:ATP-dependent DNA helicase RecQ